jgi:carbamoyltransferase
VAGGVFANVKLNQRIHELDEVDRFFVHPGMDDGGLAIGSALASVIDEEPSAATDLIGVLANVYLGPKYDDHEVERAIDEAGCEARHESDIHATIAELLAEGHVVARFCGRMEYGPRALGSRSILYQSTDPSVNEWLNERLSRTESITFDCTPEMKSQSPGVVHLDGTARPQLVDRQTAPDLHAILTAYHRLTGLPSLINTSFNLHEEPIVCTPGDALRAFRDGQLDYLAMNDFLVRHPVAGRGKDVRRRTDSADRAFD